MTVTSDQASIPATAEPALVPPAGRFHGAARPLLAVSRLNRSYGARRAVRNVSFELHAGVTGLLGPNGAGKSSLLTCLAGIAGWDDGQVQIAGIDLARHPAAGRRNLGFMPERVAFPAEMRVEEYLRFVCAAKGISRVQRGTAIGAALERTGLADVRGRVIGNLSKGYRQRVGLAQALVGDPPVVILDEPTAGLDPLSVLEIRDVLSCYARSRAVIVSTHNLPDARLMCDRVLVMAGGCVVYDGAPAGMAGRGDGDLKVRVRIRGRAPDVSPVTTPGTRLVHQQASGTDHVLVVEADSEEALGALVRDLAARWLVVGVEPTTDVLEDAFKRAVVG